MFMGPSGFALCGWDKVRHKHKFPSIQAKLRGSLSETEAKSMGAWKRAQYLSNGEEWTRLAVRRH